MQRRIHLEVLDVAEPCTEDWNAMTGEGFRRHCALCDRDVFDLGGMTADDAEQLLESGACVRFYRRADGTVATKDCAPDRLAAARKAARKTLGLAAAALVGVLGLTGGLGAATLVGLASWLRVDEPVVMMGAPMPELPPQEHAIPHAQDPSALQVAEQAEEQAEELAQ
ncbi:MAG: hypothetical protein SangKO_043940 [Sandaracinaceae bacterium]